MRLVPEPVMWDAAYDYVRLTSREDKGYEDTLGVYERTAHQVVAEGDGVVPVWKPWGMQGYNGKTSGGVSYGRGTQGYIYQASGWAAARSRDLAPPWHNCPRVDVAVTLWYEHDNPMVASRVAERSAEIAGARGAIGWNVRHIRGFGGGDTTYIGSRSSDHYIRIYDKWRESGEDEAYRFAWRIEIEAKGDTAAQIWAAAHSQAPGREYLAALVQEQCRKRGVYLPMLDRMRPCPPRQYKPEGDANDRRLAWLKNQVAPACERLLTAGVYRDTILQALGLSAAEGGE